jgi:hypothetical protein
MRVSYRRARTNWLEQVLGEVAADAALIPDWLDSQHPKRYTCGAC